jgi:nucleoside-diphosphate-sugar epimerase
VRVFITGISGPVGSFLADYLITIPRIELHAFKRWRSDPRPIARLRGRLVTHEGDVDPARLRPMTGWEPAIGVEEIVDELLAYWRERLRAEG